MRKILKYFLIGTQNFNEYKTITFQEDKFNEIVLLNTGKQQIEITKQHWILSLEPMIFGIWLNINQHIPVQGEICTFEIKTKYNKTLARSILSVEQRLEEKNGSLILCEVRKTELFHLNKIRLCIIYWMFYKKEVYSKFQKLILAFSVPRKVWIITFEEDTYFNIFPMDFVAEIKSEQRFVFGLRHSNVSLNKILKSRKMIVSEFPSVFKNEAYKLSKHHSNNPPNESKLPFKLIKSKNFQMKIPEWASTYHEILIEKNLDLGSHMLLYGKIKQSTPIYESKETLCHIHFIHHLFLKKNQIPYKDHVQKVN